MADKIAAVLDAAPFALSAGKNIAGGGRLK